MSEIGVGILQIGPKIENEQDSRRLYIYEGLDTL